MSHYVFYIGSDFVHSHTFPIGTIIKSGQYLSFFNKDINFTLVNTTSSVSLKSIDGTIIDETPIYSEPGDGMAWELIDNIWQYTNRPTPASANLPSLIEEYVEVVVENEVILQSNLEPCAVNQYRNPETNRCRLIAVVSTALVACKNGQYRSEETNRCRNIISDIVTLVPCAEGQERNPETNRCRLITTAVLGASDLVACKTGQERNPETNRCRNIVEMPKAEYTPEKTSTTSNNDILWWSLAGVGIVAIGYGAWEWRRDLVKLYKNIVSFFQNRK